MDDLMPRQLQPGQLAELHIIDVVSGFDSLVYSSEKVLFEAPNWTSDNRWLILNADGKLWRISPDGGELSEILMPGVPPINNDHVLSPNEAIAYVSAEDGNLYAVPLDGGDDIRRVSNDHLHFTYYLHGISPDGKTLAYIGMQRQPDNSLGTNVFTIPADGGSDVQLTDDDFADDGSEFSPDGAWIYFNSERASRTPGHAQLFRMSPTGINLLQLTHDERVNWFPHPAPVGDRIAYVSFPPGTLGHPADKQVIIRLLEAGQIRDLVSLSGGQGTMNVSSWNPDGSRLAYVSYPLDQPARASS